MKKLIALSLTLAIAASMGVTAFAADPDVIAGGVGAAQIVDQSKVHSGDVVYPGKTVYSKIKLGGNLSAIDDGALGELLTNQKLVSYKLKKDKGPKLIKSFAFVEHAFDTGRATALQFKLNDFTKDDEQKASGYVDVKIKKDLNYDVAMKKFVETTGTPQFKKDLVIRVPYEFWVNNLVEGADQTYSAGKGGLIIKPIKNDENEWEWENENETIARVTFEGDDNRTKAYTKLSTKWDNGMYNEFFKDTDAFRFEFVAGMDFSSTARATLELYCPFVDEDGELTCAADEIFVYEDKDGVLTDVTARWKLAENDNGEYMFSQKTRAAGTYVISGPTGAADPETATAGVPTGIVLSAYAR